MAFLFLLSACNNSQTVADSSPKIPQAVKIWENFTGLSVPESVLYDEVRDIIYVSNINGRSSDKDGKGYISRLGTDGSLLDSAWVSGLNAPKGMAISGDMLYVSDIDRLVAIDLNNGSIIRTYSGKDARFLNDVTVMENGTVFVSDMAGRAIFSLQNDSLMVWLSDSTRLAFVNGLNAGGDTLFAGVFNNILAFPGGTKSPVVMADSTDFIDGLERFGSGWIYSDWRGHVTYQHGTEKQMLLDTTTDSTNVSNAADIDYIADRKLLLVPTFYHNSVAAYRIDFVLPTTE